MIQSRPLYVSLKPFLDPFSLPRPTAWCDIFQNAQPLELEIGCGNGEYLAQLAAQNPGTNYVGFEEYCERVCRTLRKLSRIPEDNVRVLRLDVRPGLLYLFGPRTLRFVHCLYPPPWPKKSDIKHRLMTTGFLKLINNRLQDAGGMKIVTDHKPYVAWVKEQVPDSGFMYRERLIPATYNTKFERKWVAGGQKEFMEILLTKDRHVDILHKEERAVQHFSVDNFDPDRFRMKEYSDAGVAVIFKDFLYDSKRKTALVHCLVHDEHLLQNVRIVITQAQQRWRVHLASGSMLLPTPGISKAIELVRDAAAATTTPSIASAAAERDRKGCAE